MECRRKVPLENLRDDLNTYLKILRSAMIELINKDYADFVNLSTNLVCISSTLYSYSKIEWKISFFLSYLYTLRKYFVHVYVCACMCV